MSSSATPTSHAEMPTGFSVQTAEVKLQPLVRTLHVAGIIGEDETRHGIVCAPAEGRIDGLAMNCEGEAIHQRQPIATLYSRTLLAAAEDYKRALKSGGSTLENAAQKLGQLGLISEQIAAIPTRQPDDAHFGLISQQTGVIVKSYISEGQYVKEGDKLFETADFTKMWFMFNAAEKDLPLIHKGQWVSLRTASLPGETLRAKIAFISPNFDEATRTTPVRVVLENPDGRIKNKIYAEADVETDIGEVLSVPRSAVLWLGNSPHVYVESTLGKYAPRNVQLGRAGDKNWEVLGGLQADEKVVVTGNLLLDAQTQLVADQ
jgi:Cu(I)/Ag(I) efflux system membrane fusion protein